MKPLATFLYFWVKEGAWQVRVDRAHTQTGNRHVHVRRIRKGKGEYSWNEDGSRHDKHKFPVNDQYIKRAKKIAAEHLGVDANTLRLITYEPDTCVITVLSHEDVLLVLIEPGVKTNTVILASDDLLIILQTHKEDS